MRPQIVDIADDDEWIPSKDSRASSPVPPPAALARAPVPPPAALARAPGPPPAALATRIRIKRQRSEGSIVAHDVCNNELSTVSAVNATADNAADNDKAKRSNGSHLTVNTSPVAAVVACINFSQRKDKKNNADNTILSTENSSKKAEDELAVTREAEISARINTHLKLQPTLGISSPQKAEQTALPLWLQRPTASADVPKYLSSVRQRLIYIERRMKYLDNEKASLLSCLWSLRTQLNAENPKGLDSGFDDSFEKAVTGVTPPGFVSSPPLCARSQSIADPRFSTIPSDGINGKPTPPPTPPTTSSLLRNDLKASRKKRVVNHVDIEICTSVNEESVEMLRVVENYPTLEENTVSWTPQAEGLNERAPAEKSAASFLSLLATERRANELIATNPQPVNNDDLDPAIVSLTTTMSVDDASGAKSDITQREETFALRSEPTHFTSLKTDTEAGTSDVENDEYEPTVVFDPLNDYFFDSLQNDNFSSARLQKIDQDLNGTGGADSSLNDGPEKDKSGKRGRKRTTAVDLRDKKIELEPLFMKIGFEKSTFWEALDDSTLRKWLKLFGLKASLGRKAAIAKLTRIGTYAASLWVVPDASVE